MCGFFRLFGWSAEEIEKRVLRHYDCSGKECPAQMAGKNNAEWAAFKAAIRQLLEEGEEEMEKRYNTVEEIRNDKSTAWAAKTVENMLADGVLTGDGTGLDLSRDMLRTFTIVERMMKK